MSAEAALAIGNAKRRAQQRLRAEVRADRVALLEVLMDPPACIDSMLMIDVVRMGFTRPAAAAIERLGRLAVRDQINLMVPIGRSSLRTREWVCEHALWHYGHRARTLRVAA